MFPSPLQYHYLPPHDYIGNLLFINNSLWYRSTPSLYITWRPAINSPTTFDTLLNIIVKVLASSRLRTEAACEPTVHRQNSYYSVSSRREYRRNRHSVLKGERLANKHVLLCDRSSAAAYYIVSSLSCLRVFRFSALTIPIAFAGAELTSYPAKEQKSIGQGGQKEKKKNKEESLDEVSVASPGQFALWRLRRLQLPRFRTR